MYIYIQVSAIPCATLMFNVLPCVFIHIDVPYATLTKCKFPHIYVFVIICVHILLRNTSISIYIYIYHLNVMLFC